VSDLNTTYDNDEGSADAQSSYALDRILRKVVLGRLTRFQRGRLTLRDPWSTQIFGDASKAGGLHATLEVTDRRFYRSLVFGGAVGAAEAYIEGYWNCDDLTNLIRILVLNRNVLESMQRGPARITAPLRKLSHWVNSNTRSGSRRNIARHYDLGNDFFSLWLDDTMMYSSAVFENPDMSLRDASIAKLDRLCRKLDLSPQDHLLEIGTGWGGFARYAAETYGCKVTTTTISREQHDYAGNLITEAGLQDRVTLLLQDYRDVRGEFDKIVSIEMVEAVGHEYLDSYFQHCTKLLKPGGMMALQAITMADQRYDAALRSVDFIQKYIFPGGFLPSVTALQNSITRVTNMRLYHLEDIGEHYARTLREWRNNFYEKLPQVSALGYSDEFLRMWEYYYCYCEGAFRERAIGNVQMLLVKPDCRRSPLVPPLA
jgi:cyclopropane-fatty-acyl-phospholipid synthase